MTVQGTLNWAYTGDGETIGRGYIVENDRAALAGEASTEAISGTQTDLQSGGTHRHPLRAQERDGLERLALGNGLRLRHDLLAPTARLAKRGGVGTPPPRAPGTAPCRRPNRLVAGGGRLQFGAGRFWGAQTGPNPTDRGKAGSKHHLLTDAQGIPLSFALTGANIHDSTQLVPMLAAIDGVRGKVGRPRRRPDAVQGDRAYGSKAHSLFLQGLGIKDVLAKIGQPHGSGLGKTRWVIERSLSWLHHDRNANNPQSPFSTYLLLN